MTISSQFQATERNKLFVKKYGPAIIAAILCIIVVASLAIAFYPEETGMYFDID